LKKSLHDKLFWQAPGNGKGFDSSLETKSKMNNRTIGVLSYIKEKSIHSGFVNENVFNEEIKSYLQQNFDESPNDSLETHFYKPLLFYGFLHRDKNYNLSLSIEGNLFLNFYTQNNFIECKKMIVNQLDNTSYPNIATPDIKNLKLFPFRILFKLLLENTSVSIDFIKKRLVHIVKYENLNIYLKTKSLDDIPQYDITLSTKYEKFNTWVINSLVNLEILAKTKTGISIHETILSHIKMLYEKVDFKNMFFEFTACEVNEKVANSRIKRNSKLIDDIKIRDNFKCVVDNNHISFLSNDKNYVEGHHIIPMYQQKNYNFEVDVVDNIVSLCPNCHKEVHLADDKTTVLKNLYEQQNSFMSRNQIDLADLYKMYNCI
jgi:5-methylcytosine-specific restriction protein A